MFRRLSRDRAFVAALALFVVLAGHLIAQATGGTDGDRQATAVDFSPECRAKATSLLNDKQILPEAPETFLRSVDLAPGRPGTVEPGLVIATAEPRQAISDGDFEAALADWNGQPPSVRLDAIDRYITGLEQDTGFLQAYGASERSRPVVDALSGLAPEQAFTLHVRRGALRERAGASRAAVEAYRTALLLEPAGAATDERVFVRWRTAALLQGQTKAAATDALAEAAGLMNAQMALPDCLTERRASLVWALSRLYEELGLEQEADAVRDGLALRHQARWRADPR